MAGFHTYSMAFFSHNDIQMTGGRDPDEIVRIIGGNHLPGQKHAFRRSDHITGAVKKTKSFFRVLLRRRSWVQIIGNFLL